MIFGIGTDIVSIKRIEDSLFRFGDRFLHRVLNEAEVAEYAQTSQPARFLAKRFAVKEAFSKAYGTGIGAEVGWHDVAIAHDARGKPPCQFDVVVVDDGGNAALVRLIAHQCHDFHRRFRI